MNEDFPNRMNQDVKKKWVELLRSGKYSQGKSCLRNGNSFCCLGVLCDLYHKETNNGFWDKDDDTYRFYISDSKEAKSYAILPLTVQKWAGLDAGNPCFSCEPDDNCGYLNDNGKNFLQIADMIEAKL